MRGTVTYISMWPETHSPSHTEFSSSEVRFENEHILALSNVRTGERIELVPSLGGAVTELLLSTEGRLRSVIRGDSWNELKPNPAYRGRLLFPFCCRIPEGRYIFQGREYTFPINRHAEPSALHGLLYSNAMSVHAIEAFPGGIQAVLGFRTEADHYPGYPFRVTFQAAYTLRRGIFELRLTAVNDGDRDAPVAFGWHPYFYASPDLALLCAGRVYVEVDSKKIPTGRMPQTQGTRFDFSSPVSIVEIPKLDEALSVPPRGRTILTSNDGSVVIEQDPQVFKYVQFYLPSDRQSIAIEPITSPANSFNHPEFGLDVLRPGDRLSGTIAVHLTDSLFA